MFILGIIWIFLSYLLGSFPSGYLISKFSGKDILKIGWRKTSGSNVFFHVGKFQGILTGILDVLKGYLAIFGAEKLGLSLNFQIFAGILAIFGHNWSLFLKFAGGRGIGTLIGAFFALSPKILAFSLIPFSILALIWNAAIGTLIFLISAIFISIYFGQLKIAGFFVILSLFPILIKRLSPISEIFQAKEKLKLARNRFLFDRDEAIWELRIKRLIKKKEKDNPLLVREISIEDFKGMMIASAKKIAFFKEEINKINFFPVADKDTGSNLAITLSGIEKEISKKEYNSFFDLAKDIKEGVLNNARGNAGMIFAGYLIHFLKEVENSNSISSLKLAQAMERGTKGAYLSLINPIEGTILDPIKVAGKKALEISKKEKNIIKILEEVQKESQKALIETKEKLEILRENDVVDAGALGFVKILEAWLENLKGIFPEFIKKPSIEFVKKAQLPLEYRYCFQFSFKKGGEKRKEIEEKIKVFGDSIGILETENKFKIHLHTNFPEKIKEEFGKFEEFDFQIEDFTAKIKEFDENKNSW